MTTYGISTSKAHLDRLEGGAVLGEIDWDELTAFMGAVGAPTFAGRYFLGHPSDAELAEPPSHGGGFALWAHGEGADVGAPERIVPLQRASRDRQAATGVIGASYGTVDGEAIARHLDRCLAVGDLEIVDTAQILVFLEVADGTALSIDYWAGWATAVHEALLVNAREGHRGGVAATQPLVPGILCAFPWDDKEKAFLPDAGVQECLGRIGPRGKHTLCHGFWARRLEGDPALGSHTFSWLNVGEFKQPRPILGLTSFYERTVPVRYLRWFYGIDGLENLSPAQQATLSLLTLDWSADDGRDPTGAVFRTTDWAAGRGGLGALLEMPSQLGIDTAAELADEDDDTRAATLRAEGITVTQLPYSAPVTPVALNGPCAFAMRYYRPGTRGVDLPEAIGLGRNGIATCVVFQHYAPLDQGEEAYANGLIDAFVNEEGAADAVTAFDWAFERMGQPPYTPVYFAVDFPPADVYYGVATPPFETVLTYFRDVQRGLRTWLETHPSHPYYVGAYGSVRVLGELYRAGLATHFWQPPWGWGPGDSPFPHLNLWQVGMDVNADAVADNPGLTTWGDVDGDGVADEILWVDLNVAWGDPGSFRP